MGILVLLLTTNLALVACSSQCALLSGIYTSLLRHIYNPGFHKELWSEAEVMLTTTTLPDSCSLLVEETVPRGMYVDKDELFRSGDHIKALIPSRVDVELAEFEAEPFRVFVFADLEINGNLRATNISMPIHLRYQRPREPTDRERATGEQPSSLVKMQNPRLFLLCEDLDFAEMCDQRFLANVYCDVSGQDYCQALKLPFKSNTVGIEVSVPVGNLEHTPTVVAGTTLAVCGLSLYLLVSILRAVETDKLAKDD